jgi:hypothetical protein
VRLIGRAFAPNRPGRVACNGPCGLRLIGRANSQLLELRKRSNRKKYAGSILRLIGRARAQEEESGGLRHLRREQET